MVNLTKAHLKVLAALAEQEWETPEVFIENIVAKLDELRGDRSYWASVRVIAGTANIVGPFTTAGQAVKAQVGQPACMWTPEGWKRHLAEIDAPAPVKGDFAEVQKDAAARRNGWDGKARTRDSYLTGSK